VTDFAFWHRRLCPVTDRLLLSGDLPYDEDEQTEALGKWLEVGITHILDTRAEGDGNAFLSRHAPDLRYARVPTEDDGRPQPDRWFDDGLTFSWAAFDSPNSRLLVHCAMGINRGPSMAFRILLELGWEPLAALQAIRSARPIADVGYAQDALDHYHRTHDIKAAMREEDRGIVEAWLRGYEIPTALASECPGAG